MPYKDIQKNRTWHRNHMRLKRKLLKPIAKSGIVTPSTLTLLHPKVDADSYVIYDE